MFRKSLFCALVLFVFYLQAQVYSFTKLNQPYVDLTNATSLPLPNSVAGGIDAAIPLGFSFKINNAADITSINLLSEVYVSVLYGNNTNNTQFVFGPFLAHLENRGVLTTTPLSSINYKTEGNAGNRIFKIEYKNFGFEGDITANGTSTDYVNFQVWLYEGTNVIEYRYGNISIQDPAHSIYNDPGVGMGLYPEVELLTTGDILSSSYVVSGNGDNPQFSYTPNYQAFVTTMPSSSVVYRFSPAIMSTNEAVLQEKVTIYPTLVENTITIDSPQKIDEVTVLDYSGKVLMKVAENLDQKINVSNLAAGNYLVQLKSKNFSKTFRIVKK